MHLAAKHRNTLMVCLLLKAQADPLPRNAAGERAVDIAVANEDADIVAMLRMASMREEMRRHPSFSDDHRKDSTLRRTLNQISMMNMGSQSLNANDASSESSDADDDVEEEEVFETVTQGLGSLDLKPKTDETAGDPPKIPPKKRGRTVVRRRPELHSHQQRPRTEVPIEANSSRRSKAMFDYGGPGDGHRLERANIPMARGEAFEVIRADVRGWTKVRSLSDDVSQRREGFVPTSFLEEISEDNS